MPASSQGRGLANVQSRRSSCLPHGRRGQLLTSSKYLHLSYRNRQSAKGFPALTFGTDGTTEQSDGASSLASIAPTLMPFGLRVVGSCPVLHLQHSFCSCSFWCVALTGRNRPAKWTLCRAQRSHQSHERECLLAAGTSTLRLRHANLVIRFRKAPAAVITVKRRVAVTQSCPPAFVEIKSRQTSTHHALICGGPFRLAHNLTYLRGHRVGRRAREVQTCNDIARGDV